MHRQRHEKHWTLLLQGVSEINNKKAVLHAQKNTKATQQKCKRDKDSTATEASRAYLHEKGILEDMNAKVTKEMLVEALRLKNKEIQAQYPQAWPLPLNSGKKKKEVLRTFYECCLPHVLLE